MSDFLQQQALVLASGSPNRQQLLHSLGLHFKVLPSHVDEQAIKQQLHQQHPSELAKALAKAKAEAVSHTCPHEFIIAADQLCIINDHDYLDKPGTHDIAVTHLRQLSGKTHQQLVAMCIAHQGEILWESQSIAKLTMNPLNDELINAYLSLDKPYQSCGAYHFEGQGKWLFNRLVGSECTVLGLPLLPLMQALLQLNIVSFSPKPAYSQI